MTEHDTQHDRHDAPAEDAKRILGAIKDKRIAMRPRWHFALKSALAVIGIAIVLLAILYLASFAVFVLRHNGGWFVPAFGPRGWLVMLLSLPWVIVALIVAFVVVLEVLARRYSFAYRRTLLQTSAVLAAFVILGGIIVGTSPLHGQLSRIIEQNEVPIFQPFYQAFEGWHRDDVHRGTVAQLTDTGFIFYEYDGDILDVRLNPSTMRIDTDLAPGDTVVIFGKEDDSRIEADGVRRISASDLE